MRLASIIVLLLLALGTRARAQDWRASSQLPAPLDAPLPDDPMRATIHRLSNGLTVYLSPNRQTPRITAWIAVRAGSKNDPADSTGMAHYLEHMLFKGTTRLGTLDYEKEKPHLDEILKLYERLFSTRDPKKRREIYRLIDAQNIEASRYEIPNELARAYRELGVRGVNAFTSKEQTVFVSDLPKNRLEAWAALNSDRFERPVFRLFQSEIEAVYEEKNLYLDNPDRVLSETLDKGLYDDHPYGRTVIGSIGHLKNPSLAKMYEFYRKFYVPNNMAIALSGDFDPDQTLKVLEKYFGDWTPKPLPALATGAPPKPKGVDRLAVRYESEEQAVIAWPTAPKEHPDADALSVMDMLMDNSQSGIVNLTLNQAQKLKVAGSFPEMWDEAGAWYLWGIPKEGQALEQVEALLMGAVDRLKAGDFSEEDLRAVVTNFEISEKLRLESNDARVAAMIEAFTSYEPWPHAVERLRRLKRVTKADVLRVARKYLGPDRVVVYRRRGKPSIPSIQKPEFTKVALDPSRESPFYREIISMPAKAIEPRWLEQGRDYRVKKLRSGKLYAAKNPMDDLFQLDFRFRRGRKRERDLCAALELLDLSGAGSMTADDFKKTLYGLGTTLSVSCGERESGVSISGLEANLPKSLKLMRLHFQEPNISSETLRKMIEVEIGSHKDNKVNPGYIAYALSESAQYGPASEVLSELSDSELKALTQPELVRLMREYFDYQRRTAYVGARGVREVARLLEDGRKRFKPEPPYEPRRYARPDKTSVLFVHRDMVQSNVGMFAPDELYNPDHAVDYQYYDAYMGGGMSSVVFQEIREARSLAYSAAGGYEPGGHAGEENKLFGRLGCQADKTVEAALLLHGLLADMPVSELRFTQTREAIEQAYRTNPVQFRDVPSTVMRWEDLGLSHDPRPTRMRRVLEYRLKDLTDFARRFRDKPMGAFILGSRGRVDTKALTELGPVAEKKIDELFPY